LSSYSRLGAPVGLHGACNDPLSIQRPGDINESRATRPDSYGISRSASAAEYDLIGRLGIGMRRHQDTDRKRDTSAVFERKRSYGKAYRGAVKSQITNLFAVTCSLTDGNHRQTRQEDYSCIVIECGVA
jgi:hypothetical protein